MDRAEAPEVAIDALPKAEVAAAAVPAAAWVDAAIPAAPRFRSSRRFNGRLFIIII